jgi:hypothetical protein
VRANPLLDAQTVSNSKQLDNVVHPHKGLGYRSPREFTNSRKSVTVSVRSGYNISGHSHCGLVNVTIPYLNHVTTDRRTVTRLQLRHSVKVAHEGRA